MKANRRLSNGCRTSRAASQLLSSPPWPFRRRGSCGLVPAQAAIAKVAMRPDRSLLARRSPVDLARGARRHGTGSQTRVHAKAQRTVGLLPPSHPSEVPPSLRTARDLPGVGPSRNRSNGAVRGTPDGHSDLPRWPLPFLLCRASLWVVDTPDGRLRTHLCSRSHGAVSNELLGGGNHGEQRVAELHRRRPPPLGLRRSAHPEVPAP